MGESPRASFFFIFLILYFAWTRVEKLPMFPRVLQNTFLQHEPQKYWVLYKNKYKNNILQKNKF